MKPVKPDDSDCCGSGCTPCVFDVYEAELKKWEREYNQDLGCTNDTEFRYDLLSKLRYLPFKLLCVCEVTCDTNFYRFQPFLKNTCETSEKVFGESLQASISGFLDYKPSQHLFLRGPCPKDTTKKVSGTSSDSVPSTKIETYSTSSTVDAISKLEYFNESVHDSSESSFISRAYTPISVALSEKNCCFDIIVKLYENGEMSAYFKNLTVGDIAYFRGPFGGFEHRKNVYSFLTMICAGTGIAPMVSLIKSIISDETDETIVLLLFSVRTFKNIIFRQEIQDFSLNWNVTAKIYLSNEPIWDKVKECMRFNEIIINSRIDETVIKTEVLNRMNNQVLLCGPPGFCSAVHDLLPSNSNNLQIFCF